MDDVCEGGACGGRAGHDVTGQRRTWLDDRVDVLLAAFLAARVSERSLEDSLRQAVAAGAASTLELGAGRFEPREASRLLGSIEVRELERVTS